MGVQAGEGVDLELISHKDEDYIELASKPVRTPGFTSMAEQKHATLFGIDQTSLDTINTQDNNGWTSLALSCTSPSPTILPLLLSHGADPELPNHAGDTPLHIALQRPWHMSPRDARCGSPALELIKADVDLSRDAHERTALHLAAQFHNLPAATLLLSKGASPNVIANQGQAPLCLCSNPQIAFALLEYGADVHHTDNEGFTALQRAVDGRWVKTFKVLVEAGADVCAKTGDGGESAQSRIERMGGWREWAGGEWEAMCKDVEREESRVREMEGGF